MAGPRIRIVWPGGNSPAARLRRFYVGSFVFHGLLLTVFIFAPKLFGSSQPLSDEFFDVMHAQLVADLPEPFVPAAPTPPPVAKPLPKPAPKKEEQPVGGDVKFSKRAAPTPKEEQPKPPPPIEPEPTEEPADESGSGDLVGDATAGVQSAGEISLFGWYQNSVSRALYSTWRRPVLAGLRDSLAVLVTFEIQRDGSITGLRVAESSGISTLDRSALRAVADASPLPRLPPAWRESKMTAAYLFQLNPEDY